MTLFRTPALVPLDLEIARLSRPRRWARVQEAWAGEPSLVAPDLPTLVARLRGTSHDTDVPAAALVARAGAGDEAALTVVLATLAGVFVAFARRRGLDVDTAVADQLSLATEVVCSGTLPTTYVFATVVSRTHARHRRLRHRTRSVVVDQVASEHGWDDTEAEALARVDAARLGALVRRRVRSGAISADDWRRLVDLRVHGEPSAAIAAREGVTPEVVRKRAQRTLAALGV